MGLQKQQAKNPQNERVKILAKYIPAYTIYRLNLCFPTHPNDSIDSHPLFLYPRSLPKLRGGGVHRSNRLRCALKLLNNHFECRDD